MNMSDFDEDLVETVNTRLYKKYYSIEKTPSEQEIKNIVQKCIDFCELSPESIEINQLVSLLYKKALIKIGVTKVIKKKSKPWLYKRTSDQSKDLYSKRYESFLLENTSIAPTAIKGIFSTTDKILDLMADPLQEEGFKKKGLVVGNVQSGKTANYLGLINKAADVGYKLIILIAGVHNNLRSQTQKRVNEGFIGFDTLSNKKVGVGLNGSIEVVRPYAFTNVEDDFKNSTKRAVNFEISDASAPVILVVKKNASTLKNIIDFLRQDEAGVRSKDYPLLLIDDEADNASINTKKKPDETTRINGQIREVLNLFNKSAYVGFTATPFANIFIDPEQNDEMLGDDLFPEDFIVSINPPENYIGANEVFITQRDQFIRDVFDDSTSQWDTKYGVHKEMIESITEELPETFKDAICVFLLTIALKKTRAKVNQVHTSMLVNISHLNHVQVAIKKTIDAYLKSVLHLIKFESQKGLENLLKFEEGRRLHRLWSEEFKGEGELHELLTVVNEAQKTIRTLLINSKSKDKLDYDAYSDVGLNPIAIGGYSLSRGFTLEGLTVSYFLRNSKMYDTLLQMGRWFGYREGYDDICRVYLSTAADSWYSYIAGVLKELDEEISVLERHNLTPIEYGLKVRNFPGSLLITAKNKMYSGKDHEFHADFSSQLYETRYLSSAVEVIEKNLNSLNDLVSQINHDTIETRDEEGRLDGYLWKDISVETIQKFMKSFETHRFDLSADFVSKYISLGQYKELNFWDVYLPSNGRGSKSVVLDYEIETQVRSLRVPLSEVIQFNDAGGRVVRFFDEKKGLSGELIQQSNEMADKVGVRQTSRFYRELRKKPLLVLKLLTVKTLDGAEVDVLPAFGISFPKSHENRYASYVVSKVWFKNFFGDPVEEESLEEEMNDE